MSESTRGLARYHLEQAEEELGTAVELLRDCDDPHADFAAVTLDQLTNVRRRFLGLLA